MTFLASGDRYVVEKMRADGYNLGDDLAVLLFVLKKVWGEVSEDVKAKAQDKLKKYGITDTMIRPIAPMNTI